MQLLLWANALGFVFCFFFNFFQFKFEEVRVCFFLRLLFYLIFFLGIIK